MKTITIYRYQEMSIKERKRLFERSSADYEQIKSIVTPLMQEVRDLGDQGIFNDYARRSISVKNLLVSPKEFKDAYSQINPNFLEAFNVAKNNILQVCKAQKKALQENSLVNNAGIKVWREWRPIQSIGIYTPGGHASYPSCLAMCAIPAIVAGCQDLRVCSPPSTEGKLPPELLVTANELGIKRVFKVGGSQAIAAMAYGTESISQVLKIVGPGNQYVNAAKLLVYPKTAIDLPAGPSENLIIADETANPQWVAADLITDLEHGPDSAGILLTPSHSLAIAVRQEIEKLLPTLATQETIRKALDQYCAIIVVSSLKEVIDLSNEYGPEHMQIMTKNARKWASQIKNVGSVFIGDWSTKAGGDYASGANHVLPTGQSAKTVGALSVDSYGKWVEFQQASKSGFLSIKKTIETYADVEGLPAHKLSSIIRN